MEPDRFHPTVGLVESVEEAYRDVCLIGHRLVFGDSEGEGMDPKQTRERYEQARKKCLDALSDRVIYLRNLGVLEQRTQEEYEKILYMLRRLVI